MNKAIIFGSNGMIGHYISNYLSQQTYLKKIIQFKRKDFDPLVNSTYELEKLLLSNDLDDHSVVINAIGLIPQANRNNQYTDADYLKINSIFTHTLAGIINSKGAKLINISTDCVFNGNKGNYIESDQPDESNIYGLSKYVGEPDNCCNIRTSFIGEEKYHKRSLLEWIRSNKNGKITGFTNALWNGLTALQLTKVINQIIKENLFWIGVRHIYSPQVVSKFELVSKINKIYNLNIEIEPIEIEHSVDKTLTSIYSLDKFKIPNIDKQIIDLKKYKI